MNKYSEKIYINLSALGIKTGDIMLIHSSLRSLGGIAPADVIDGITAAVGESGTVVFPTLSYEYCGADNPVFNELETRSNVGALPEYFRLNRAQYRSLCPTHSCAATGKYAREITAGHILDSTPCGEHSPFRKLRDMGGKILFIGCGTRPNTSMHAVEELSQPDYLFGTGQDIEYMITDRNGYTFRKVFRAHWFENTEQRYERLEPLMGDGMKTGFVAGAECKLYDARIMWREADRKLRENSNYFVDITQ